MPLLYSGVMKRNIDIRPTDMEFNCSATKKVRKQEQSATSKTTTTKNIVSIPDSNPSEQNTTSILDFITMRHKKNDAKNTRCQPYPDSRRHVPDSNPSAVHIPVLKTTTTSSSVQRQRVVIPVHTAHNIALSLLMAKKLRPYRKQHVSTTSKSLECRRSLPNRSRVSFGITAPILRQQRTHQRQAY